MYRSKQHWAEGKVQIPECLVPAQVQVVVGPSRLQQTKCPLLQAYDDLAKQESINVILTLKRGLANKGLRFPCQPAVLTLWHGEDRNATHILNVECIQVAASFCVPTAHIQSPAAKRAGWDNSIYVNFLPDEHFQSEPAVRRPNIEEEVGIQLRP
jgi:hypothetical protein